MDPAQLGAFVAAFVLSSIVSLGVAAYRYGGRR